ncbi:MAG: cation:proton antiporter subunit C [Candidatus Izimaplasma sp.]|nr:cation:proton antiporter subunit C [Candidatus Izimaplasma bacterium]
MLLYASVLLIVIGLYGLLTNRNVIKIILSLNVLEIGLNIFIITVGFLDLEEAIAPIITLQQRASVIVVDPLPQALVLTAIVIGVGTTAIGLSLAKKMYDKYHTFNLDEMGEE